MLHFKACIYSLESACCHQHSKWSDSLTAVSLLFHCKNIHRWHRTLSCKAVSRARMLGLCHSTQLAGHADVESASRRAAAAVGCLPDRKHQAGGCSSRQCSWENRHSCKSLLYWVLPHSITLQLEVEQSPVQPHAVQHVHIKYSRSCHTRNLLALQTINCVVRNQDGININHLCGCRLPAGEQCWWVAAVGFDGRNSSSYLKVSSVHL